MDSVLISISNSVLISIPEDGLIIISDSVLISIRDCVLISNPDSVLIFILDSISTAILRVSACCLDNGHGVSGSGYARSAPCGDQSNKPSVAEYDLLGLSRY